MDWGTSNMAKSSSSAELMADFYSEAAKGRARAYIKKMNGMEGYPLYALPEGFDAPRTFGIGTFGLPILILSFFPLVFPFWLWILTIETGFPYFAIFGLQITFLPLQIMGYVVHLTMNALGGKLCKKFRMRHFGAARGVEVSKFIFWDISVRAAAIPVGAAYFGWLAYVLFIR